jgi:hypothetical protein
LAQFTQATSDGIAVQSGDAVEEGDTTAAVLLGEEADEEPAGEFIGLGHEAVDGPMLLGGWPVGVS